MPADPARPGSTEPPEDEQPQAAGVLHVSTMFGYHTRKPIVKLTYDAPGREFEVQLSVAAARNLAQDILEVTESAVADAFLVEWLRETVHLEEAQAAQLMVEFRVWRAEHRE